jgi:hypothetical protein
MDRLIPKISSLRILEVIAVSSMLVVGGAGAAARQRPGESPDGTIVSVHTLQTGKAKPDLGIVSGNVYTNDSFGLTYAFPSGWLVDKDAMDSINEQPTYASGQEPNKNPLLLMVSQLREEPRCGGCLSVRVGIPRILIYAGRVPSSSKYQAASDVLLRIKETLNRSSAKIVREPVDCSFGGQTFSRMDVKWELPKGGVSYTGDAVIVRGGYLIQFTIFADSLEQLDELFQTLNSLQFKP